MKVTIRMIVFLAGCWPCHLPAQSAEIMADTSITWAAYFELLLPADPLEARQTVSDEIAVLKLQNEDRTLRGYINHSLNSLLWNNLWDTPGAYFADADLSRSLSEDEFFYRINGTDTTVTFDPETGEEKVQIIRDAYFSPFECPLLKTRQILTYNNTLAKFDLIPVAISPAQPDGKVFFWAPWPGKSARPPASWASPDISWAVRQITGTSSPALSEMQVIKGGDRPLMQRLFERIRSDAAVPAYTRLKGTPITFKPEDIYDLQLTLIWFWEKGKQQLQVSLRGIAPRRKLPAGQFPLFYLDND